MPASARVQNGVRVSATSPSRAPRSARGTRSDRDGRLEDTEDASQGVADLAERDARPHRLEDRGKEIGLSARRPVHPVQGAAGRVPLALLPPAGGPPRATHATTP